MKTKAIIIIIILLLLLVSCGVNAPYTDIVAIETPLASPVLELAQSERDFLDSLGELQVRMDDNFAPISTYNTSTRRYEGVAVDVLELLSNVLGFDYQIVYDEDSSWPDLLDMVKNNEIHILGAASINESRMTYGYFTEEVYMRVKYVLIGSVDHHQSIQTIGQISENRIGLVDGISINDYILSVAGEDADITYFATREEALNALKANAIDMVPVNEAVFLENYFKSLRFDYEIIFTINDQVKEYAYFSPKTSEGKQLTELLSKGMRSIDMDAVVSRKYEDRSVFTYYREYIEGLEHKNDQRIIVITGLVFLMLSLLGFELLTIRQNKQLRYLSTTDHLTGLKNRNALFDDYSDVSKLQNTTIYFIDIDDFKLINDTYGHEVGDLVLKKMAQRLKGFVPGADIYRIGGDEFLIIDTRSVELNQEGLLKTISQPVYQLNKEYKIQGSIGLLDARDFQATPLHQLINLADYAMMEAKVRGKNNIVRVTREMIEKYRIFLSKKL